MTQTLLLVQTAQGDTVAVRFPSAVAARDWEDAHPEIVAVGTTQIVSRSAACELS